MIERIILKNLCQNADYAQQSLPFLHARYFENVIEKAIYTALSEFVTNYHTIPSADALKLTIHKSSLIDDDVQSAETIIDELFGIDSTPVNLDWLKVETEKWVQDKAVANAIYDCLDILEDEKSDKPKKKQGRHELPKILSEALAVSFDTHIGHDLITEADHRFDYYHQVHTRVPFDLKMLNRITNGGLRAKTLNVLMASTGVGKTMVMCHIAARAYLQNKVVLYITMEMGEESIAERVDANLFEMDFEDVRALPKSSYLKKIDAIHQHAPLGRLIVKEYPTTGAHTGHFRHLLHELKLKRNLVPDLVIVDYLNICASARFQSGSLTNIYQYVKAICEDLRGLAVEFKVPILTATQTNRSGYKNENVELDAMSESSGTSATADLVLALIVTDDHIRTGRMAFKQLKNRYEDFTQYQKFEVGVNRRQMRLYDVSQDDAITIPPPTEHAPQSFVAGSGGIRRAVANFVPTPSESIGVDPVTGEIIEVRTSDST